MTLIPLSFFISPCAPIACLAFRPGMNASASFFVALSCNRRQDNQNNRANHEANGEGPWELLPTLSFVPAGKLPLVSVQDEKPQVNGDP